MPRRSRHAAARSSTRWLAPIVGAVVVFMLALGVGLVHTPAAMAAEYNIGNEGWVQKDTTSVQFTDSQGNVITPGTGDKLDYGDAFKMRLDFVVPNNTTLKTGDTLVYDLPAGITYATGQTYPMTDASGTQLGSYVIRDNKVIITYTGQDSSSDITGFVTIDGSITSNSSGGNTGGPTQFKFPGYGTVDVDLNPHYDLNVVKNGAISVPGHPDLWDFVLDVESIGNNTGVHLTDTMGKNLHLYPEDSPIIVCADPACTTQLPSDAWTLDSTTDNGFNLTIKSMTDKQKYYVKYRVRIDRKDAVEACKNGWECTQSGNPKYDSVNNTVSYSSEQSAEKTTEKGIWLDSRWSVSKGGADGTDASGAKMRWTIEIWPGEDAVVDGTTIRDQLGELLAAPTTDPTVTCYAHGAEYHPPIDCGSLSWSDLVSGKATLPVPEGGTGYGRYQITYTTPITDGGSALTYTNDVTVTPPDEDGHDPQTAHGTGKVEEATAISKSLVSAGNDNQTLHWMTTFTAKRAVASATITDTLDVDSRGENHGPLQTLDAGSIRITTDREGKNPWNGMPTATEATDSGFTLTFGELPAGTTLYIFYTSTLTNPEPGATLYNTVSDGTHKSTAQHVIPRDNMAKSGWQNGSGTITWRLQVHDVSPSATSVAITDTLPDNLGYVPGSLAALDNPYYPRAPQHGAQVQDNGDGTLTFTITPGTPAFQEATTQDGLWLEYTTKIIDYEAAKQAGEYKNSAHIAVNGVTQPDQQASVWMDPPGVLDKSGNYNAATAPNIEYTVRVNEGGLTLNGGRTLTLTDTLGEALAVRLDSVAIRDTYNRELAGATYAYNPQTRELVFRVPDGTPCVITYKATVQLAAGETFGETNGANTISLKGSGGNIADDNTKQSGTVEETRGGLTATDHMLQVFKYADHDVNAPLAGIQFTVEALNVSDAKTDGDGKQIVEVRGVNSEIPAAVLSTNSAGYTEGASVHADTIYRVTEQASEAYEPVDPLFIVFPGGNSTVDYANMRVAQKDKTYPLTVGTMASHVWMCNNDHKLKVKLNLSKTDELGNALKGATLQLTRLDGTAVGDEWTSDGNPHTIEDLTPGTYLLVEKSAPEGYTRADDVTIRVNADGTIIVGGQNVAQGSGDNISADVTMRDTPTTTSVRAKKIWDDADDQDGLRKDAVFDLSRRVGSGDWQIVPGQNRTIPAGATGEQLNVAWASLPTRAAGEPVEYRVQEREIDAYTSVGVLQKGVWTFTNTHTPATTRVRVQKVWDDADDVDKLRPGAVTVRLYADGEPVRQDGERVLSAENNWKAEFTDLPKYAKGQPIMYTVMEAEALAGYTVHYSYATGEDGNRTVTVTNTHEPQTSDLRIAKQNIAGEQIAGARLRIDGIDAEGRAITPIEWTSQADGPLPVTLAVQRGQAEGESARTLGPGTYTLRELEPPSGYTSANPIEFTVTHEDGEWHVVRTDGASVDGNRIVMTDYYLTTDVPISKRTLTGADELPGAQLELTGTRTDGTSIAPIAWTSGSEPRIVTLLPGDYTLREVAAPSGYERAQDVVFRVHVGGAVEVRSGGTLSSGAVTMRDAMRTMTVFFSKTAVGSPAELPGAQFELVGTTVGGTPASETWTSGGEMHELTLADGTYTLTETKAPEGYDPVSPMTVIVRDGRLIVNEIAQSDTVVRVENEPTPMTAVSVMKQWQDNGDVDDLRPDHVQVQLMAGDKEYGPEVTLNSGNSWTATWANLPKLGADGEEVDYTIREILDYGDGYHVSLRKTQTSDGLAYSLVNIHQPDAVELRLAKHWADANNQDGKRPGQIGVSIWGVVQDGDRRIETQLVDVPNLRPEDGLLSADGNTWQWHLYGLPKVDAQNRPYSFELRETGVPDETGGMYELVTGKGATCDNDGHCAPTPGSDADGKPALIEFTNTHTPETVRVHVGKTWIDRDNADGTRPESLAVWLLSSVWDQSNGWPTPQYGFSSKQDVTFTELKNPFTESIPADELLENGQSGECVPGSYAYGRSCIVLTPPDKTEGGGSAEAGGGTESGGSTVTNVWEGEFTDLLKYHNGELIRYVVTEQQVSGYDASLVIGNASDSNAITCTDCSSSGPVVGLTGTDEPTVDTLQFQLSNRRQMALPSTGGTGTHRGMAAGFMLMAAACMGGAWALARGNRRKEGVQ